MELQDRWHPGILPAPYRNIQNHGYIRRGC